jgi:hypothetical protein
MKADLFELITSLMAISSFIFSVIIWIQFSKMKNDQTLKKEEQQDYREYTKVPGYHTALN